MHVADDISITRSLLSITSEKSTIFLSQRVGIDNNEGESQIRDRIDSPKFFKRK